MAGFVGPEIPGVTDGLVAYYDAALTYTSGSTTWYDEINGNNGTLTNGPTFSTDGRGSIVFDGTNDFTSYPTAPLDFSSTNFSIEASFKTTTSGVDVILGQYPGGGDFWMGINSSKLWFSISLPSNKIEPQTSFNVNDNQWKIATATIDNSTYEVKLYVNGTLADTRSGIGSYPNSSNNFTIGKFGNSESYQFPGSIAEVKIYNRALSSTEVLQNYNALKSRFNL